MTAAAEKGARAPRAAKRKPTPSAPRRGAPAAASAPQEAKGDIVIRLMRRKEGATLDELCAATGWQAHSVRGFIAGTLKKKGHTAERRKDGDRAAYYLPNPEEGI